MPILLDMRVFFLGISKVLKTDKQKYFVSLRCESYLRKNKILSFTQRKKAITFTLYNGKGFVLLSKQNSVSQVE